MQASSSKRTGREAAQAADGRVLESTEDVPSSLETHPLDTTQDTQDLPPAALVDDVCEQPSLCGEGSGAMANSDSDDEFAELWEDYRVYQQRMWQELWDEVSRNEADPTLSTEDAESYNHVAKVLYHAKVAPKRYEVTPF